MWDAHRDLRCLRTCQNVLGARSSRQLTPSSRIGQLQGRKVRHWTQVASGRAHAYYSTFVRLCLRVWVRPSVWQAAQAVDAGLYK